MRDLPRTAARQIRSSWTVAPAEKPGTPALMAPCPAGDVFVTEGGCLVKVTYKGKTYRGTVPPPATSFVCGPPPLDATKRCTTGQERCGLVSDAGIDDGPRDDSYSGCCRIWWNPCSAALASSARGRCPQVWVGNTSRPDANQQSDILRRRTRFASTSSHISTKARKSGCLICRAPAPRGQIPRPCGRSTWVR